MHKIFFVFRNRSYEFPKSTFIIVYASAEQSAIMIEIRKTDTEYLGSDAIIYLTVTDTAAMNVKGNAIHFALKVATYFKPFTNLKRQAARNL